MRIPGALAVALGLFMVLLSLMLGAFMTGVVIAFVFAYRRSPPVDLTVGGPAPAARAMFAESGIAVAQATSTKLTIAGRAVEFSPEVMAHIRAGNKIEAIKVLRSASGLDLKGAKEAVEAMATHR